MIRGFQYDLWMRLIVAHHIQKLKLDMKKDIYIYSSLLGDNGGESDRLRRSVLASLAARESPTTMTTAPVGRTTAPTPAEHQPHHHRQAAAPSSASAPPLRQGDLPGIWEQGWRWCLRLLQQPSS